MVVVGYVLSAMAKYRVTSADIGFRGTQLKMTLVLDGQQQVVFKPRWYFQYLFLTSVTAAFLQRSAHVRGTSCCHTSI